jgi:hypothetical protein
MLERQWARYVEIWWMREERGLDCKEKHDSDLLLTSCLPFRNSFQVLWEFSRLRQGKYQLSKWGTRVFPMGTNLTDGLERMASIFTQREI